MGELDEIGVRGALNSVGGGTPLVGMQMPRYSIVNTGNPEIDTMLSQFLLQQSGIGKFLPQQMPAQNLLDQMVSAKYMSAMKATNLAMREADNVALYQRLLEFRNKTDSTPATELQKIQLQNTASMMNNEFTRPLISALLGPQMMEDAFFGQKGSREMLSQAIGGIGFARPDSVLGGQRMSNRSLEVFTDQLYNNLYGPDADLNDISGFSAGRVGTIATELSRRGLLPQSMRQLTADERRNAFDASMPELERLAATPRSDTDTTPIVPADVLKAIKDNAPLDEIAEMEGGGDTIRRVDANRVASTLKDYSKAIATVREIFGDNGISNAPMGQVMAAMSALTQNSLGSMDPARLNEVMRKTQMVARDAGVSLEGLMGLSARTGALAEMNGLPREFAQDNAILAMERLRALQTTGGFKPGFGRMDPDKAVLSIAEDNTRADVSPIARHLAVAQTALDQGLIQAGKGDKLKALLATIGEGRTLMYDPVTGTQTDVYEALGSNPEAFLSPMLEEAGLTPDLFAALNRDPGTLEALKNLPGRQLYRLQAAEVKKRIGFELAQSGDIGRVLEAGGIDAGELPGLTSKLSDAIATTAIEDANTKMTAGERINTVRQSMLDVFTQRVIARGGAGSLADARTTAETEMLAAFGGDETKLRQFISARYAEIGTHTQTNYNQSLAVMQQKFNRAPMDASAELHTGNIARVKLFESLRGSESTLLQRLSDTLMTPGGSANAVDKMLGIVNRADVADKITTTLGKDDKGHVNAVFADLIAQRNALYMDTKGEVDAFMGEMSVTRDLDTLRKMAAGTGAATTLDGASSYMTTAEVAENIKSKIGKGGRLEQLTAKEATAAGLTDSEKAEQQQLVAMQLAAETAYKGEKGSDAKFDINDPEHLKTIAGLRNVDDALRLGLGPAVLTEGRLRGAITDAANAGNPLFASRGGAFDPAERDRLEKQQRAFRSYTAGLQSGAFKAADILEMRGITAGGDDDAAKTALAKFLDTGEESQLKAAQKALETRLGADPEKDTKIAEVIASGRFARTVKNLGGFDAIGVQNASQAKTADARIRAIQESAANLGASSEPDSISKLVEKAEKGTLSDEERKKFNAAIFGSEAEYKAAVEADAKRSDGEKGSVGATVDEVLKKAQTLEATTKMPELAGLGGALTGIGASVAAALKEAFAGEVKIQTASIDRVEFRSAPDRTDSTVRPVSATLKPTDDDKISGTVRIAGDLRSMFVQIARSVLNSPEIPPGVDGVPVRDIA